MPYVGYKGDKTAARPTGGSLVETRSPKAPSLLLFFLQSHAPDRSPEQAPGCCSSERTCPVIYVALCFDVAQGRMNGVPMRLELTRVGLLV